MTNRLRTETLMEEYMANTTKEAAAPAPVPYAVPDENSGPKPVAYRVKNTWSTKRGYETSVSHKIGDVVKASDLEMTIREYPEGHSQAKTPEEQRVAHVAELVMIGCLVPIYEDESTKASAKLVAPTPVAETVTTTGEASLLPVAARPTAPVDEAAKEPAKEAAK